jgi:Phosphoesterase family
MPASTLWVADGNARARAFYVRAGFSPTGIRQTYTSHDGSAFEEEKLVMYFDHVPPPPAVPPDSIASQVPPGQGGAYDGFGRYGFRVPCAAVSPWARAHHVSHQVADHTSILKLVETKWNLPALTYRDANASGLLDLIDLRRPAFAHPPSLAKPLLDTGPGALACNVTGPGTIPPPGSVSPPPGSVTPAGSVTASGAATSPGTVTSVSG